MHKNFESLKYVFFVYFNYWTTNSHFDDRFQHPNPRSLQKFRQQLHKNF